MKFLFHSCFAHFALDPQSDRVSGGAELQTALLAKELAARGHEVVVVGSDCGRSERIFQNVRTRSGGKFHTGGLLDTLRALPVTLRILREEKPDHVAVFGWTTWLFVFLIFKKISGYSLVFICGSDIEVNGGFARENPIRGALFEFAKRRTDARFAMTETQRALFEKSGMSCGMYRNLILPRTGPRRSEKDVDFLWVSRCVALKRPHIFLDLAEKFPAFRFAMICPNEDDALWRGIAARAEKMRHVEFRERVPYRAIQDFYDRAHVFVNTSEYEGFPNSFVQAGQGGATILSLSVDSDGMLSKHAAGICAGGDPARFFSAAQELMSDREKLALLQKNAARFVDAELNNDKNVAAFLAGVPSRK